MKKIKKMKISYALIVNYQIFHEGTNIDIYIDRRPVPLDWFVRVLHSFIQLELFSAHIDFNRQKVVQKSANFLLA